LDVLKVKLLGFVRALIGVVWLLNLWHIPAEKTPKPASVGL
jgi:hypothetical protein